LIAHRRIGLMHGVQPWGRDSRLARNLPISSHMALIPSPLSGMSSISLPFSCPFLALCWQRAPKPRTVLCGPHKSALAIDGTLPISARVVQRLARSTSRFTSAHRHLCWRSARSRVGTKEMGASSQCEAAANSASCRNAPPVEGNGLLFPYRSGASFTPIRDSP
jgi:hypothetical protein